MTQADANVELIAPLSDAEAEAAFIALVTLLDGFGCCPAATVNGKEDDGLSINLHFSTTRARTLIAALNTRVEPTLHPLPSEALAEIEFVLQSVLPLGGPVTNDHITEAAAAIYTAMQRSTPTAPVQGDDAEQDLDVLQSGGLKIAEQVLALVAQHIEPPFRSMEWLGDQLCDLLRSLSLSGDNNAALVEALPIATAPKTPDDLTETRAFLGWCPDEPAPHGGDWRVVWWEPHQFGQGKGAWFGDRDLVEKPTDWLPLPPPLSITSTDADGGRK